MREKNLNDERNGYPKCEKENEGNLNNVLRRTLISVSRATKLSGPKSPGLEFSPRLIAGLSGGNKLLQHSGAVAVSIRAHSDTLQQCEPEIDCYDSRMKHLAVSCCLP